MNVQSIKDRLRNIATENNRLYQEVLTVYALERTIFRIGKSNYKDNFTLKGGIFLYALYDKDYPRSTVDIDLRADKISASKDSMISVFSQIFQIKADDCIEYDTPTLTAKELTKQDEYQGINVSIMALLGNIRIPVSIDIGFGDIIVPSKSEMDFPVLLDMERPKIYTYSIESALAEKFEAIVSLGYVNSRYKDFYDIFLLLRDKEIDREVLKDALTHTFSNRNTSFDDIVVFEDSFSLDDERQKRWKAFIKKKRALLQMPFDTVVKTIKDYFMPIVEELVLEHRAGGR